MTTSQNRLSAPLDLAAAACGQDAKPTDTAEPSFDANLRYWVLRDYAAVRAVLLDPRFAVRDPHS